MSWMVASVARAMGYGPATDEQRLGRALRITELYVYPVKGCGGASVEAAALCRTGFEHDRQWAVCRRDTGDVLTQRTCGRLKQITARIVSGAPEAQGLVACVPEKRLELTAPGCDPVSLPVAHDGQSPEAECHDPVPVHVWKLFGTAREERDAVNRWLSDFLGLDAVLMRIADLRAPASQGSDACRAAEGDRVAFHDYSSLHVITEEGLKWVDREAPGTGEALRFRPNMVVAGAPFPEEDRWLRLGVQQAPVTLRVAKRTQRCSVPTLLPSGAPSKGYQPTKLLKEKNGGSYSHRLDEAARAEVRPLFGLNLFHDVRGDDGTPCASAQASLSVGMSLAVEELVPAGGIPPPEAPAQ